MLRFLILLTQNSDFRVLPSQFHNISLQIYSPGLIVLIMARKEVFTRKFTEIVEIDDNREKVDDKQNEEVVESSEKDIDETETEKGSANTEKGFDETEMVNSNEFKYFDYDEVVFDKE
ncbi:hypothetical protein L6452_18160 [Arctium lappa]|uniref:Uncharacterized protein n=1 Tax=Arctium lappa TaxID=4217 RepID=A0ACB9C5M5_ARCLA|nr:hypothetical protein L6452_18160 [Arctium lappa]